MKTQTKTITVYVACDGQEFSDPLDCEKHEAEHICSVSAGQVYRDRDSEEKLVIFETWNEKIIFGGLDGNLFKGYSRSNTSILGERTRKEAIDFLNNGHYYLEQP